MTSTASPATHASPTTDAPKHTVTIGLLGLGTVGQGVYKLIQRHPWLSIKRIAVQSVNKSRPGLTGLDPAMMTTDPASIVNDPSVHIIVEVMGGLESTYELIKAALNNKKHVVTANKMVIATYGPELFALAKANGVLLMFEAAVAGGIPVILPLMGSLAGNRIEQMAGILNGTTNFILSQMERDPQLQFADALAEAQAKGFAEADPTADVDGFDARSKLAILAMLAFQRNFNPEGIYTEGIRRIHALDIQMAEAMGYRIRLIGLAQSDPEHNKHWDLRVHPMLVPAEHPLAKVMDEHNALWVHGDAVSSVMFYGKGAGEGPTASSVMGDLLLVAKGIANDIPPSPALQVNVTESGEITPIGDTTNAYYIRLEAEDEAGVIGHLGMACGEHNVSIDAIWQKGTHPDTHSATIVLRTHPVKESAMQAALDTIRAHRATRSIESVIRVFAS